MNKKLVLSLIGLLVFTGCGKEEQLSPRETAYYEYGTPTVNSSTNYDNIIKKSNVFVKLVEEQLSVCIYENNTLECFKNNNFEEEIIHLQNIFGAENCEKKVIGSSTYMTCINESFECNIDNLFSGSAVLCRDIKNIRMCTVYWDDTVFCD